MIVLDTSRFLSKGKAALLVPGDTGVIWTSPLKGKKFAHLEVESFFVPIPNCPTPKGIDPLKGFRGEYDMRKVNHFLRWWNLDDRFRSLHDPGMLNRLCEGWVPIYIEDFDPLDDMPAVLVYMPKK